jgi:hypothetical protein
LFESKSQSLLPRSAFYWRLASSFAITGAIIAFSLGMGSWGYHSLGNLPWIDALLNASMILTGMGPVDPMRTTAGKLFASFYALYSGIAFLTMVAVVTAPIFHRLMHRFHMEDEDDEPGK